MNVSSDAPIRLAAFQWLAAQVAIHGEVLPRRPLLEDGFEYDGNRIHLLVPQGICKPAMMDLPLSISTTPDNPYKDKLGGDHLLYRYQGSDPNTWDNVGLKACMQLQIPLVYFHGHIPGRYHALWPVFIEWADDSTLTFGVRVDVQSILKTKGRRADFVVGDPDEKYDTEREIRRRYTTREARQRLHQDAFREQILHAYHDQCALCRLRHRELLEAAHIIPDSEDGEPIVSNGLSLCRIHHTAYDKNILGVTPDYDVHVRQDILEEIDGPMLRHGLQEMHGKRIWTPRKESLKPDRDRLAQRFEEFRRAG